ncbi:MarR family winged helix-turn-helix transcriptional regulator [Quadrisphaera sp. DSM 44207]|uniref:MarR family winged helix-turn-helix transcriptional regulator n=1 Tax=Quadrisphaera sp. DSM 44207 TaxID=1881057 RepID=UPI000886E1E1|nr:MarR family transcriptional regulator [Quadrisphaera sp. DSM 44207]SDQ13522.1 transcriptional regulator, MarR family [Quadrisphaera sp. DSM 44207]
MPLVPDTVPARAGAATDAALDADPRTAAAGRLVEQVAALTRIVHSIRAAEARRSAHGLLFPLLGLGPLRVTALADAVHADASTISRQVADLVREGLVRREPDPVDGRAHLLAVTDAGADLVARTRRERTRTTAQALPAWTAEELDALATALTRLTTDLTHHLSTPVDR